MSGSGNLAGIGFEGGIDDTMLGMIVRGRSDEAEGGSPRAMPGLRGEGHGAMAVSHSLRPARSSWRARLERVPSPAIRRLTTAFGMAAIGMALVSGWATNSSLVWLAWLAVGFASGFVARSSRATVLMVPATVLTYLILALLGRTSKPVQWMPEIWALLALFGAMVTAAGFAAGAAISERRITRTARLAFVVGLVSLVTWVGIAGYVGSDEVVVANNSYGRCDTPATKFGWAYEAINYDKADDVGINPDAQCPEQGAKAGSAVVTADGIGIAGWYIPAGSGAAATGPTIVISPGWKTNKSESLKYAAFFHQRFNLVLLDLRNQHRSGGDVTTFGYNERQDVKAMIDWLEKTKHPAWIGATGNSMGAATVLGEAVGDPRVRALILDSMHASFLTTFTDGTANERNLPGLPTAWAVVGVSNLRSGVDIPSVDPAKTIATVGNRPVLLIHGTNDILDTVEHAAKPNYAAAQAAGVAVTIQYCEGGGHGKLVEKCPAQWQAWVDAFFAQIPELQSAAR